MGRISVIIPTVRGGDFLRRAVSSVVAAVDHARLHDRVEVVVGDDGWRLGESEFADLNVVARGIEVKTVRTSGGPAAGPSAARNSAIRASSGDHLFTLDDDDLFLRNRFDTAVKILDSGSADAVLETTVRSFAGASDKPDFFTGPPDSGLDPLEMLLSGNSDWAVSQGAVSFRRDAFERVGGYNESLRFAEDGELLCKFALVSRIVMKPGPPVTRYFYHSQNISAAGNVFPWQNVRMLSELYRFAREKQCSNKHLIMVRNALQGKFDYAMWVIGTRQHARQVRLRGLYDSIAAYPVGAWTTKNVRSATVAICRSTLP